MCQPSLCEAFPVSYLFTGKNRNNGSRIEICGRNKEIVFHGVEAALPDDQKRLRKHPCSTVNETAHEVRYRSF